MWLEYDGERTDRYDRCLAYVYVQNRAGAGYLCVNVAVLEEGLANYYAPGNTNVSKRDIMLKASKVARSKKANIWKSMDLNKKVVHTRNGSAFHSANCEDVRNAKTTTVSVGEAFDLGLNPCRNCKPV
ncbi:micrococcal nuclease [Angomonas deanei]|nr:micrococcal nuclease [Angomonas deanei]|eukprot:EPY41144.1 micrococcal nuclease [Angomonas deanei]